MLTSHQRPCPRLWSLIWPPHLGWLWSWASAQLILVVSAPFHSTEQPGPKALLYSVLSHLLLTSSSSKAEAGAGPLVRLSVSGQDGRWRQSNMKKPLYFLRKHQLSNKYYGHGGSSSTFWTWKRGGLPGREEREGIVIILNAASLPHPSQVKYMKAKGDAAIPRVTPLLAQTPDHSAQLLVLNVESLWQMGPKYSSILPQGSLPQCLLNTSGLSFVICVILEFGRSFLCGVRSGLNPTSTTHWLAILAKWDNHPKSQFLIFKMGTIMSSSQV